MGVGASGVHLRSLAATVVASALAIALAGCGASPLKLARTGHLLEAFDALGDAHPSAREAVLRAILDEEAPSLTVEALEDDALVQAVGGHTARQVAPAWVLLRARLTTRARVMPYVRFALEIGREGGEGNDAIEVPSFALTQKEGIVTATGERMAEGHTRSTYKSELCEALGILCVPLAPVALIDVRKTGEVHVGPSADDIARAAPRAGRLFELLVDQCEEPGKCTRYLMLRRPREEDQALSIRVRVGLSSRKRSYYDPYGREPMSVVVTAPIRPGKKLGDRFPVTLALAKHERPHLSYYDAAPVRFCAEWSDAEMKRGEGRCLASLVPIERGRTATVGLAAPPPPASLGTFAESAAMRPWWSVENPPAPGRVATKAPGGELPKSSSQDPAADTELMVCKVDKPWRGWMRFTSPAADAPWAPLVGEAAVLPLAHLAPMDARDVEVWSEAQGKRALVATAAIERRGAALVTKKLRSIPGVGFPTKEISCTPYDRAAVEAVLAARWPAAVDAVDRAAEAADSFHVDPTREGFRFPDERFTEARAAVSGLAALVGWADPRVSLLVERIASADAGAGRRIRATLAALLGEKRDAKIRDSTLDEPRYSMRVLGSRCDAGTCALVVELTGSVGRIRGLGLQIVMDDGRVVRGRLPEDLSLASGEAKEVLVDFYPDTRIPPGTRPWALVQNQFFASWVRLVP